MTWLTWLCKPRSPICPMQAVSPEETVVLFNLSLKT